MAAVGIHNFEYFCCGCNPFNRGSSNDISLGVLGSEPQAVPPKPGTTPCKSRSLSRTMSKDWEMISTDELKRRQVLLEAEEKARLPLPELLGESCVLEDHHIRQISSHLPYRVEGYSWHQVYSTAKNGFSLATMYRNMGCVDSPILLIVQDVEGAIFGGLTSQAIKTSDHFYGQGETYLFSFLSGDYVEYKWTGENNFFMKGDMTCFCIGCGHGKFGLWLDGDLYRGRSACCDTFNNDVLSSKQDFVIKAVEAWAFVCE